MHAKEKSRIAGFISIIGLVLGVAPAASAAPPPGAAGQEASSGARSVTLVTGDRVIVPREQAQGGFSVRPAAGREGMAFSTVTHGGHVYVLPADAGRLVAVGRVDRRLFDVTTLIESGYDDARTESLPLIVTHPDGQPTPPAALAVPGTTMTTDLSSVDGVALRVDKPHTTALWNVLTDGGTLATGVDKVWLDGKRQSVLDRSMPKVGASAARDAGYTGAGVTVAVLDTGVDQTHPDLAGREIAERNFSDAPDTVDHLGYGTHVASIIAGTGASSGGEHRGVAGGASLLDGKVLGDNGLGQESWIIAGMQWAAEQGATVANLGLGGTDTPEFDPVEEAVNTLSARHGTLFVIAAGNDGAPGAVSSPGRAEAALTVGAVDRVDNLAEVSGRGPRTGDGAIKPDITASGAGVVAGVAALLADQHPQWTGAQLKAALAASATPAANLTVFDQGSGRVDVARAIAQTVIAEPSTVGLGVVRWPHRDDEPVTTPLTYRNLGASDVTLSLAVEATGPDGQPAADDLLALSANEITVPAGGSAEVTVIGDTTAGTVDGTYSGVVIATAGETATRTPVGITREAQSYDLRINFLGPNGQLTADYNLLIAGLDNTTTETPYDPDGSVVIRLPRGRYALNNLVWAVTDVQRFFLLPQPNLALTRDTTVTVDARTARPVRVIPPEPAQLALVQAGYRVEGPVGALDFSITANDLRAVSTGHVGPPPPAGTFTAIVNTQWITAAGSFYGLAWFPEDRMPTGFTRIVNRTEVATVRAEFGPIPPVPFAVREAFPVPRSGAVIPIPSSVSREVPAPGARTEYHNAGGVRWITRFSIVTLAVGVGFFDSPIRTYQAGRVFFERFNFAVFGPALPASVRSWATRTGDVMDFYLPLFGDTSGNAGFSFVASGTTRLLRGDELIGETSSPGMGTFQVPPQNSQYRLSVQAVRPDVLDVTTRLDAEWTFRSGQVPGRQTAPLELSAIRFTPRLDNNNAAPAGQPFLIPVTLQRHDGSTQPPRTLTVAVSYDGGLEWQPAQVVANRLIVVQHPAGAQSVSLRAQATDQNGNTVSHTIIRAYKLA